MNQLFRIVILLGAISTAWGQNIGINGDGSAPDASAILDVKSTDQGMLVPRVDIADLSTAAPVTSPATSLVVYNTNATTGAGFYYWSGSAWVKVGAQKVDDLTDGKAIDAVGNLYLGSLAGFTDTGINQGNTGIGYSALRLASSAQNTALGLSAGANLTGGGNESNTFIGAAAGGALTTGIENIFLGADAGKSGAVNLTSGSNNIVIGVKTELSSASASNELNLGDAIYGTNIYTATPRIGIGDVNAPNSTLQVNGSLSLSVITIPTSTASYAALESDHTIIKQLSLPLATSIQIINLPDPTTCEGRVYVVKLVIVGGVTPTTGGLDVLTFGGATIDGAASYLMQTDNQVANFQSDGTNWYIIGSN